MSRLPEGHRLLEFWRAQGPSSATADTEVGGSFVLGCSSPWGTQHLGAQACGCRNELRECPLPCKCLSWKEPPGPSPGANQQVSHKSLSLPGRS